MYPTLSSYVMDAASRRVDFSTLLKENKLPFFAYYFPISAYDETALTTASLVSKPNTQDIIFLYKVFESDCFFAKCFSQQHQSRLLHNRLSYVSSENPTITNNTSNPLSSNTAEFMFNDIVSIPYNYKGLFEIFSSSTRKTGGILDHIRDVVVLASRLKRPKFYYLAKELKVYELIEVVDQQSVVKQRKLVKLSPGSIIKAEQIVSIDYNETMGNEADTGYYAYLLKTLRKVLCCSFYSKLEKKKCTHACVEVSLVNSFDELAYADEIEEEIIKESEDELAGGGEENINKLDVNAMSEENKLPKAKPNKSTTYYLPLYETYMNTDIDLIPISLLFRQMKQRLLKTNSLQIMKNFALDGELIDENYLELKLVNEDPFKSTSGGGAAPQAGHSSYSRSTLHRVDQHLELSKYKSIFDVVDYKPAAKILAGFSLKSGELFFMPVDSINKLENSWNYFTTNSAANDTSRCLYQKVDMSESDLNQSILKFKSDYLDKFLRLAQAEIDIYGQHIQKLCMSIGDIDSDVVGKTSHSMTSTHLLVNRKSESLIKDLELEPVVITQFADLANVVESVSKAADDDEAASSRYNEDDEESLGRGTYKYRSLPTSGSISKASTPYNNRLEEKFVEIEMDNDEGIDDHDATNNSTTNDNESGDSSKGNPIISRLRLRGDPRCNSMPNRVKVARRS